MVKVQTLLGLVVVACLSGQTAIRAEERKLNAGEITEALRGNTVDGRWGASPYRSYFDSNGVTIYQQEGMPADHGKWRVDREQDRYCSWWARTGWGCYDIYREGDTIIWADPHSKRRYPSTLLQGKQLK